jgi:acetyl-CoA carboxylase carboxyl transferase subunit alpha
LWKDRASAAKAATALKISANDLLHLQLVDDIVPEPLGGAHNDAVGTALNLKTHLLRHLEQILALPVADRLKKRYEKFRAFGHFLEKPADSGEMKPAKPVEPVAA